MGNDYDPWLSPDKLYHVFFCLSLTLFFSTLANHTRFSLLRRLSVWIGSLISLAAGAAKEVADQLGYFYSAGASAKDVAADVIGVLVGVLVLSLCRKQALSNSSQCGWVLPV